MTSSRHMAAPMRARRHWTTDRIISAGLAVTACAGIVGVIGVRSIEDSAAAQQSTPADAAVSATEVLSSAGLTEAQLDEYAAQLQAEAARLDAYRVKLTKAAKASKAAAKAAAPIAPATTPQPASKRAPKPAAKPAPKPAAKPVAKPAPKPAPKPAAQPQSNTKSS